MQTVAIGADHGGFELKQLLAEHIRSRGMTVEDCGTHSTEAVDYPKIAAEVAQRVADGRAGLGVIVGPAFLRWRFGWYASMLSTRRQKDDPCGVRAARPIFPEAANSACSAVRAC